MDLLKRVLPYLELGIALVAAGLWYQEGGAVWYAGGGLGPWPLVLLAIPWLLRLAITRRLGRPGLVDAGLALFLASAAVGVWAAYAPGPALAKFWLIIAAIGLYYAVAHQPDLPPLYVTLAFFGVFGVVLTLYFLATNDWAAHTVKVPQLVQLGRTIGRLLPNLVGHRMHPNVVGGLLALVLPLYLPLIQIARSADGPVPARWRRVLFGAWIAAAGLALLGLLLTVSRGAWMASLVALGLWGAWRVIPRLLAGTAERREWSARRAWRARLAVMAGVVLLGAGLVLAAGQLVPVDAAVGGPVANRYSLLRDSSLLARDYLFTGAGLGMYPLQFSTYTLLLHVTYIVHSHNLLMNVLIEQGLAGLLGFALVIGAGVLQALARRRHATPEAAWIIEAALAGLVTFLVHGTVDDALYGSRGLLLLFVPLGLALAAGRLQRPHRKRHLRVALWRRLGWRNLAWILPLAGLLVVIGAIVRQPVLSSWYANLGALEQSRAELGVYDPDAFAERSLDDVRRQLNLNRPMAWFGRSLAMDPGNPTARQRLAGIALARGQYQDALTYIEFAWADGHRDSVTRSLLGDAYVANGRPDEAFDVLRGVVWAADRLRGQAWSRYWLAGDFQRAADAWAVVVAIDPDDRDAARSQAEAARRAARQNN